VLEYLPYRKTDGTAVRDSELHPYFAGHGYAAVRVDMRGTGDSDGILLDEYLLQEQDDALEVLEWLAAQPWCTGKVGIIGKSWGGFNGLQIAARRPPQLGAVISVCSTDDRYADDVHYMGGCVLASRMLPWGANMVAMNALPPDPAVVGERWRELWLERLERTPAYIEAWLTHQRRDGYWRHGSVCEDFAAIECPVYAVGGWADGYSNAIPRLLAGLSSPRKGLIGPWGHQYPQSGVPGPAIGFLQECVRWWDHWLKEIDTGVMDGPMLRVWLQEWAEPSPSIAERPGRWIAEPAWPAPTEPRSFFVTAGGLADGPGEERTVACPRVRTTGLEAGVWCPTGGAADHPSDQRAEDGLSLCFDSEPLAERLELLGFPEAVLTVLSDRPLALVAVRLCDVAPDGTSLLVTRGLLNLAHRESHEEPSPLEPGRPTTVTVRLNAIAHAVPPGHRLRLAVSSSYWPWAWPPPAPVALSVVTGSQSRLELPMRLPRPEDERLAPFGPPESAPPLPAEGAGTGRDLVNRDRATGLVEVVRAAAGGGRFPDGLVTERTRVETCSLVEGDPLSASVRAESSQRLARGAWRIRIEARSLMTADAERFTVTSSIDAYEEDTRVFASTRSFAVARDLV